MEAPQPFSIDFPASKLAPEGMKTLKPEPEANCMLLDNIVYAERDDLKLTLQILLPPGTMPMMGMFAPGTPPPVPKPFVVYVPGSAWFQQAPFMNIPQIATFAKRGYVVAVAQYRPSTVAPFPAQIIDIKAAVKYLKKNAVQYGIDPEKCFLWGDSSGGHTVAMIGVTGDDILPCPDYPEVSVTVKGVIDFFGPSDLARMGEFPSVMDHIQASSPEGFLLGGINVLENKDKAAEASPQTYITKERSCPPFLLAHGDGDKIVPFGQSVLLYEKLRETGKKVDFYKLEGADHGSGEFSSKEVYDLMEAFIQEHK